MRRNMVVSRYVMPTGIPHVNGLSTGPSGFKASHDACVMIDTWH